MFGGNGRSEVMRVASISKMVLAEFRELSKDAWKAIFRDGDVMIVEGMPIRCDDECSLKEIEGLVVWEEVKL